MRKETRALGRMAIEGLRQHLEQLSGAEVLLEDSGVQPGQAPVANDVQWTWCRMTGDARGTIGVGAPALTIRQMVQLAMSDPVDTGEIAVPGEENAAELTRDVRAAWEGLLADTLRLTSGDLRGAFGWSARLALSDRTVADEVGDEARQSDGMEEQEFVIASGGLRFPVLVRTVVEEAGTDGAGEARGERTSPGESEGRNGQREQEVRHDGFSHGDGGQRPDLDRRDGETGRGMGLGSGMGLLMDIKLEATLRFGSRELSLQEVLSLGPGGVVELDRHVSEPVDLVVGDKIVARDEVVLVNGNFGLRVTEVATPQMRLESIRCLF